MKTLARQECKTELLRRLRTVRPESGARWGRMSAHQMVCHVSDACRMAMGEKPVSDDSGPLRRTVVKWIALYTPFRWRPGIRTRPEIDPHCAGTKPVDFAADVAELERLLERMAARPNASEWPHPIFGRMSHRAWLRWAYLHTDHHLRQFGV